MVWESNRQRLGPAHRQAGMAHLLQHLHNACPVLKLLAEPLQLAVELIVIVAHAHHLGVGVVIGTQVQHNTLFGAAANLQTQSRRRWEVAAWR